MEKIKSELDRNPALVFIVVLVMLAVLAGLTSCKTNQYGCKGRTSWSKMVKQANRYY